MTAFAGHYVRSLKKDSGGHTEIGGPRADSACRWSPQSWPLHRGPAAGHVEPHGIGDGNPARASASWLVCSVSPGGALVPLRAARLARFARRPRIFDRTCSTEIGAALGRVGSCT